MQLQTNAWKTHSRYHTPPSASPAHSPWPVSASPLKAISLGELLCLLRNAAGL